MPNLVSEAANGCLLSAWIYFKLRKAVTPRLFGLRISTQVMGGVGVSGDNYLSETSVVFNRCDEYLMSLGMTEVRLTWCCVVPGGL